jgi:2-methylcitrate dehydratase PrpD
MSILEKLSEALASASTGRTATELLRLHVADTVGAWVAGAHTAEGQSLLRFVSPRAGRDGMLDGVMLSCAVTRLSEIDNIHLASGTTPAAVVIPAALTLAAALQVKDRQTVNAAMLAGYEAMVRLGLAIDGPKVLYRGIWPTYFVASFGVAAVASRLMRLGGRKTANALGMALSLAAPNVGQQGGPSMSRWLLFGAATRNGGVAALAAEAGFSGDVKLLDGPFLTQVYGITPTAGAFTEGLDSLRAIEGISYKPWCAARQTMAASQAMREMAKEGLSASDIEAIAIGVPGAYLKMVNHGVVKGDRSSYLTSAPYQVATALAAPETAYALEHSPDQPGAPVQSLMDKVTVSADETLDAHFPKTWPAKVTVSARSGRREQLVLHIPGDPQRAFAEADVSEKFRRVLSPLLGVGPVGELLATALRSDEPAVLVAAVEAHYPDVSRAA